MMMMMELGSNAMDGEKRTGGLEQGMKGRTVGVPSPNIEAKSS